MARDARKAYLAKISDEQLTCMVMRHAWPILELSGPAPKGFRTSPGHDGCSQMIWTCSRCGTERTKTTLPRNVIDVNALYKYDYPDTWIHITADWDLAHADLVAEWYQRRGAALFRGQ